MAFWQYEPNYFAQLPYQSSEQLQTAFRFENFDYQMSLGLGVIVPFKIGKIVDSCLSVMGLRQQEKNDHFHDMSFDRHAYYTVTSLTNTINISDSKPNLKLTVSGYYISPLIQGLYKIDHLYDLSAGLKWLFANEKASLTLNANNIFRSSYPTRLTIDEGTQHSRMNLIDNTRYVGVAFAWKFGGYKEKNYDKVDKTRFTR